MRVGAIPYLNAVPLLQGLPWTIERLTPSALQQAVLAGTFDLALCSITTALCHEHVYIVPGLGIGCRGPVASVRLIFRPGIASVRECRRIALDPESNTANLLLKVLLTSYYGCPRDRTVLSPAAADADARLVIGDRALTTAATPNEIDLGAVWSAWTGHPFVFATWMTRTPTLSADLIAELTAVRDRNVATLDTLVAELPAGGTIARDRLGYLQDHISYRMAAEELEGMRQFFAYLVGLGLAAHRPFPLAAVV